LNPSAHGGGAARGLALVGGGARSGKSRFALELARGRAGRRAFVATAEAFDEEMRLRIDRHVADRGGDFFTIEAPRDLEATIAALRGAADVVVVDCLTLWLSNLLVLGLEASRIEARVVDLAGVLAQSPFASIVVTNEVGMGIVPEAVLARLFRDVAGRAHELLARSAREIYFATTGVVVRLRPGPVEIAYPRDRDAGGV